MKYTLRFSLALIWAVIASSLTAGAAVNFPESSVLSAGRWVKVKVDSTGVQRIPYDQLRAWGFSHPEKVAVHGFGSVEMSLEFKSHPVDLPAVQVVHKDDALFFYGEGETRYTVSAPNTVAVNVNRYSRGSYYFLSEDIAAATMPVTTASGSQGTVDTHTALAAHYPRVYNPTKGGAYWYGRSITDANPYILTFGLDDYVVDAYMGYRAIGKHSEQTYMWPVISASAGVDYTPEKSTGIYKSTNEKEVYRYTSNYVVAPFTPGTGVDKVTFTLVPDNSTDVELLCLDNMWVTYSRRNALADTKSALSMNFPDNTTGKEVKIYAPEGDLMVWDVTDVHNVTALSTTPADGGVVFNLPASGNASRKVETFFTTSTSLGVPTYEGEVPNTNLHAINGGYDMVIIAAASDFLPAARRLAEAHAAYQGLNVLVTSKEDVLNEFGSGSFTSNGIRLFSKMLFDRDNRYRYLLLMGDGLYDNAKVASATNAYIPTYQAELQTNAYNVAKAYTCDSFYGFVEDNIAPDMSFRVDGTKPYTIDIAVGRFPVGMAGEAEALVDKAIAYLEDSSIAGNPAFVMMMADKGNENQHMQGVEAATNIMLGCYPGLTVSRCYDASYNNPSKNVKDPLNTSLVKHIKAGFASNPGVIMYAGHGGATSLFSESIVTRTLVEEQNFGSAGLFLSASCHPYTFDYEYRGLLTDLMLKKDGGSTFVIGPAREVFLTNNQEYCNVFARRYFDTSNLTIGDVFRATLNEMETLGQSLRINSLSFNLGGDPAMPLPRMMANVTLDQAADGTLTFNPCRRTRLSGEIRNTDGSLRSDFNGTLNIQIYDTPVKFLSYANVSSDNDGRIDLTLDETVLAEFDCEVKNGKWETYVTVPAVNNENGSNRVALVARPDKGFAMAAGYTTDVTIAPYDEALATPDNEAPDLQITIDDVLADGARVETSRTPSITITMADSGSGISMNRAVVGSTLSVSLDNRSVSNIDRSVKPGDGDGVYTVTFSPGELADGRHTIKAGVSDNAGNIATCELDFFVVEEAFACSVEMESDIVKTSAEFTINHPLPDIPEARIVIEDLKGRHILSRTIKGDTFTWDLKDGTGAPVVDGSYRVYAVVGSHPRYSSTAPVKFTVIR